MVNFKQTNIMNIHKISKYILMGFIIIIALKYIPCECIKMKEILIIGAISSIVFAMFDMISPSIMIQIQQKDEEEFILESV